MIGTVDRARGRWREILPLLGIETRFLVNRHGPCPLCGGRDRYRFDDKDGSGSYYCNQCGPGTGLMMAQKLNGWSFAAACAEVDKIIGTNADASPRQQLRPTASDTRASAIERVLAAANRPAVVHSYLSRRGALNYFVNTSRLRSVTLLSRR